MNRIGQLRKTEIKWVRSEIHLWQQIWGQEQLVLDSIDFHMHDRILSIDLRLGGLECLGIQEFQNHQPPTINPHN